MRAFAVSMMVAAVLTGCSKGNVDGTVVRTNPVLPDSRSARTIHTGTEGARRYVSIGIAGGSNYTHFRAADVSVPASSGFYRYDYLSPEKRPGVFYTAYRYTADRMSSATTTGTVWFDGPGDRAMRFDAVHPEGNGRISVWQTISEQYSAPLATTLQGRYSGSVATPGRKQQITLDIDASGALATAQCGIVGRADPYKDASVARVRLTIPPNNGCGLTPMWNVDGILFFESRDSVFLMADQREGNEANGVYGEFTRIAGAPS